KNGPKLSLERTLAPSAGSRRYVKPADEELLGNVPSSACSRLVTASRVAAAAASSPSKSPVETERLVSRNDSTSRMVCALAWTGPSSVAASAHTSVRHVAT